MVAGGLTRSNVLGFVGRDRAAADRGRLPGLGQRCQGGESRRSQSREIYLNSFDDAAAGREAALALIRVGADMFHHNADAAALGLFQAVKERRRGVRVRSQRRPIEPGPEPGPRQRRDRPAACLPSGGVRGSARDGSRPEWSVFGLESGVVSYVPNPRLDSLVPPALRARMRAATDSLIAGTLIAAPRPADHGSAGHEPERLPRTRPVRSEATAFAADVVAISIEYLRIREIPDEPERDQRSPGREQRQDRRRSWPRSMPPRPRSTA